MLSNGDIFSVWKYFQNQAPKVSSKLNFRFIGKIFYALYRYIMISTWLPLVLNIMVSIESHGLQECRATDSRNWIILKRYGYVFRRAK